MADQTFEEILESVARDGRDSDREPRGARTSGVFWSVLSAMTDRLAPSQGAERHAQARMAVPPSADPEDVARELGLTQDMSADQLHAIRRAFARRNHPDFYGQEHVEVATVRMQIANALIDRALTNAARPASAESRPA